MSQPTRRLRFRSEVGGGAVRQRGQRRGCHPDEQGARDRTRADRNTDHTPCLAGSKHHPRTQPCPALSHSITANTRLNSPCNRVPGVVCRRCATAEDAPHRSLTRGRCGRPQQRRSVFTGEMREKSHPAVHDATERQPAQTPVVGLRLLATGAGAVGDAGADPGQPSDRRRFRRVRLTVPARPVPARGPLPAARGVTAGTGRGAACRCQLRRYDRRRRPTPRRLPGRCPASRWSPTRPSPRRPRSSPYVVPSNWTSTTPALSTWVRQLRAKVGVQGINLAGPPTAG